MPKYAGAAYRQLSLMLSLVPTKSPFIVINDVQKLIEKPRQVECVSADHANVETTKAAVGVALVKSAKRRRGGFLDALRLDNVYLRKPDRKTGRPGLLTGFDLEGDPVLVKIWLRQSGAQDGDLQEIWHHEVRQPHRLGGYPGAAESIAPLHQAGLDDAGFYLVLKPGQRRPLA